LRGLVARSGEGSRMPRGNQSHPIRLNALMLGAPSGVFDRTDAFARVPRQIKQLVRVPAP